MNSLYSYSVFKSSFTIFRCVININIQAPKIEALHRASINKIAMFFKSAPMILMKF
jgi:hypothetical protein